MTRVDESRIHYHVASLSICGPGHCQTPTSIFANETAVHARATMSSQGNKGIPLWHAPSGVGYKLLELPPELVSQLEGDNPPMFVETMSQILLLVCRS